MEDSNFHIEGKALEQVTGTSPEEIADVNMMLQELVENAPSDSTASLSLTKCQEGYRGLFKISSCTRNFVASCAAPKLASLAESIIREIKTQIDEWRQARTIQVEV